MKKVIADDKKQILSTTAVIMIWSLVRRIYMFFVCFVLGFGFFVQYCTFVIYNLVHYLRYGI